jgi:hypothetical protein
MPLKPVPSDCYHINGFSLHKVKTYQFVYGGGGTPSSASIDVAEAPPPIWGFDSGSDPKNKDGIFTRTLYYSAKRLLAISASSAVKYSAPTGSQFYVVNIGQLEYGEGIFPGSVSFTFGNAVGTIVDDKNGNLINSYGNIIGTIFYSRGIAIISQDSGSFDVNQYGMYLVTGSNVQISLRATRTIYEHSVICTMEPGELNYSINPTVQFPSSSVSGTVKPLDGFASGSLTPYMTSVGLYNDQNQLVAVAKFANPIKRAPESQQTVIVRFDI